MAPHVDMPRDLAPLAKASNALAFDLYARLRGAPGNLSLSPASISIALSMTWGGAKAETAAEMKRALHLEGDADAVMASWGRLAGALQDPRRQLKLKIANRLFGERTFAFEQPFLAKTKAAYGAPLESLDFKSAADASRKQINGWVEDQTEKRIKDLLPPDSITPVTRMVLVNAIYFLADWLHEFEKDDTYDQPFAVEGTKQDKTVPMMHQRTEFRLAKSDGVKLLELPYASEPPGEQVPLGYKGADTVMWIALPDQRDGLPAVEQTLDAAKLATWVAALKSQPVVVSLPRFAIDPAAPLELSAHLSALGMKQAFDAARADFTGIGIPPDPQMRLYISAVFHKAFVKVDEKGTEAAAATAVVMAEGAGRPPPAEEFNANHPFVFFIVDKASGLILFMGRVVEPT